ncbi:MAG: class I SAM-dependent methyltransferase [Chitinophagaceae bacterium]
MEWINHIAEDYAQQFSSPLDEILQELETDTRAQHPQAHMLSGSLQGQLLQMISQLVQPKYILEIGTFTGFSALCLAKGLQEEGQLHTIEIRSEDARKAQFYFEKAGLQNKIKMHVGDARSIIPELDFKWDMVFIDADKTGYIDYYELTLPRLKQGGLIIADNVLFHGQVLESSISGKSAKAIHAFNEHVSADSRSSQVMLTVRDGLLFIKKL